MQCFVKCQYNIQLVWGNRTTMDATLPVLVSDPSIHWDFILAGKVFAFGNISYLIGKLSAGSIVDRFHAPHIFLFASALMFLANFFISFQVSFWGVGVLWVLFRFFMSLTWPCMTQIISSIAPPSACGRIFGFLSISSRLGVLIGGVTVGQLLNIGFSWRFLFIFSAGLLLWFFIWAARQFIILQLVHVSSIVRQNVTQSYSHSPIHIVNPPSSFSHIENEENEEHRCLSDSNSRTDSKKSTSLKSILKTSFTIIKGSFSLFTSLLSSAPPQPTSNLIINIDTSPRHGPIECPPTSPSPLSIGRSLSQISSSAGESPCATPIPVSSFRSVVFSAPVILCALGIALLTPISEMTSWWVAILSATLRTDAGDVSLLAACFPMSFIISMSIISPLYDRISADRRLRLILSCLIGLTISLTCMRVQISFIELKMTNLRRSVIDLKADLASVDPLVLHSLQLKDLTWSSPKVKLYENGFFGLLDGSIAYGERKEQEEQEEERIMNVISKMMISDLLSEEGAWISRLPAQVLEARQDLRVTLENSRWLLGFLIGVVGFCVGPPFFLPVSVLTVSFRSHAAKLSGVLDAAGYVTTTFIMGWIGSWAQQKQWVQIFDSMIFMSICAIVVFYFLMKLNLSGNFC